LCDALHRRRRLHGGCEAASLIGALRRAYTTSRRRMRSLVWRLTMERCPLKSSHVEADSLDGRTSTDRRPVLARSRPRPPWDLPDDRLADGGELLAPRHELAGCARSAEEPFPRAGGRLGPDRLLLAHRQAHRRL